MKKKLPIILIISLVVCFAIVLTGCEMIQNFLSGGTQNDDSTEPKISSITTIKAADGYLQSKEYEFNKNCTNPMALDDGEEYYVIINYENPDAMSISSVKINGVKYSSMNFDPKSTPNATYIKFAVPDTAESQVITYEVGSVFYVNGTSTTKMKWGENVERTIDVAIRPKYTLTLCHQDEDLRMGSEKSAKEESVDVYQGVYYNTEMSYTVEPEYNEDTVLPTKDGGWVFTGWYTKPNGEGIMITPKDKYYFWCDMTLYACFERMYELEVVELEEPINYSVMSEAELKNKKFTSGVVVKNRNFQNNAATKCQYLEIPDTVVIEKREYTETTGNFGLPTYNVTVGYTEYPVVKIDNNAFDGFNTILTATIGKYIEEIGYCAFKGCTKLKSFDFASNAELKYIGDYAFENTKALGKVPAFTLPDNVEYIGNMAFRDSGWTNVRNINKYGIAENTSTLYVKSKWKFLGYKCFFNTGFSEIIFEPGCYFEGQITDEEGSALESNTGYRVIQKGANKIGARLFAACLNLSNVEFQKDANENNALNLIPDYCFDIFSYENDVTAIRYIQYVHFEEGLKYIGQNAFYYQRKIPELKFPKSLEEVDREAFYECISVNVLDFGGKDSQLKILHSSCFGNLVTLDSCKITSSVFYKYGSGVFRGCDRLKCVIFDNDDLENVPVGFKEKERVNSKGKDMEVIVGHYQSDFLYATGEAGEKEDVGDNDEEAKTYSSPMRVFCPSQYVQEFEEELKRGKEVHAGSNSSGTSAFNTSVFVHSKDDIHEYSYTYQGTEYTVTVAIQKVYRAKDGNKTNTELGWSLVYWATDTGVERSRYLILPTANELGETLPIIEIAMYSIPTSAQYVYIPSSYKRIDHDGFNGCTALTEIEFQDKNTLEYIGDYAFLGTRITGFEAGTKLMAIGAYAFQRCTSLQWVDLSATEIINQKDGRVKNRDQCKYDYELEDYELDNADCLGESAFTGCRALTWIKLPKTLKQIRTGTFTNCTSLVDVILMSNDISDSTAATNKEAFYEYGQATAIYAPSTTYKLQIYVPNGMIETHEKLFERPEGKEYKLITEAPARPDLR